MEWSDHGLPWGFRFNDATNIVAQVTENSAAGRAGLRNYVGYALLEVDGQTITNGQADVDAVKERRKFDQSKTVIKLTLQPVAAVDNAENFTDLADLVPSFGQA